MIPHPASYPGPGEIIAKLVIMLEIEPAELLTAPTARNGGRSSNRGGPCVQKRNRYGRKWGLERMNVYPPQGAAESRPIEVAVVVDPALDVRIELNPFFLDQLLVSIPQFAAAGPTACC